VTDPGPVADAPEGVDRIGCVIPTHDRPELLREALDSVLAQRLPPAVSLDIVAVDDAGSPETAEVVAELAASLPSRHRLRLLVRTDGPPGASASRNAGARTVDAGTLAFLDDDDAWTADHLQCLVERAREAGAEMAVAWMDLLDRDGSTGPLLRMRPGLGAAEVAVDNPGFTGSNFLISRSAFERIGGFDAALPVANDKDFLVRFLQAGFSYAVSFRATAIHREHDGPQLTNNNSRRAAGIEAYIAKHHDLLGPRGRSRLLRTVGVIRFRAADRPTRKVAALAAVGLHTARGVTVGKRSADRGTPASLTRTLRQDLRANRGQPHIQVALGLFRLAQAARRSSAARPLSPLASALYRAYALAVLSIDMPVSTAVGPGLVVHHGFGIVVHNRAVLGPGVVLRQGVTIGTRSTDGPAPTIGAGAHLGAGAIVLGGVSVGAGATVGAGSVVLDDVPAGGVAVGNPARIREPKAADSPAGYHARGVEEG
jgi:serine acetyltransferase/GT2 family glycosyltransferase